MKTAISIPEPVYEAAEQLAGRLGISRSELYTAAVAAYVAEHREEGVTEALNRIYPEEASSLDPVLQRLQLHSLPPDEW